jgi:hypothetical protein
MLAADGRKNSDDAFDILANGLMEPEALDKSVFLKTQIVGRIVGVKLTVQPLRGGNRICPRRGTGKTK